MPLLKNRPPRYRRHSSGQAFVEFGSVRRYLGGYGSTESRERYQAALAEWNARDGRPVPRAAATLTTAELLAAFWLHAERHYVAPNGSPTSELSNFRQALRPVAELYASTPASDFSPLKLKACRDWMVKAGWCRR